ncbi:hypothetical protein K503DRAFT_773661 [Rhizopogon vinicolor AM-OR11-026]|uniref:Phosphatases II n=1 Tax=Rhizopogon vinicolor AM-OR11-026 TaxID=1314800 RepID=A0A1B7MRR6_9AGAM|nr:hypothetical protein K503DRAFT_773661 [Rhizopogon vinicolor AM-OR11-026]
MKSPPLRLGALRTGGFLSPPALSMGAMPKSSSPLSTVPRATSPLALSSSFPPSNREGFNLTLPGGTSQVRGPPQFNLAVIPPSMEDKLGEPSPVDDYVNASYVQPLGTRKRYIATQGPLPATFVDFWTLVWEQNVHVIVMLTREIENAMVKCGTYWTDPTYGPLQLQLLSTSPPISPSAHTNSADAGFFLALRERDNNGPKQQPSMIVRTFALSHRGYPGIPPRRVTHLQYLEWPDMNVPEDPRGVLELIKRVERAVQESTPGPSPSGSNSHSGSVSTGSGSGSLSPSSGSGGSPGRSHHERGEDFFASPPLGDAGTRRKTGRKGWRHPELDVKTGIAAFALGCAPPVLLHCSAGVGRTGGFIAVDAVLDAMKREISQRREIRARARARVGVGSVGKGNVNVLKEMESGTESGGMDVDADADEGKERMIGTVPLVMGDRKKARRHHVHKGEGKSGETSSSESLVVHVPVANSPQDTDAGEQTKDVTDTKWQSSTREWAEQVLDQTHPGGGERESPPLPLSLGALPAHSRRRSPDSRSNSSAPSVLNSADDSVGSGSGVGDKAGSRSGSARSGSDVSGKGSGTGGAPPSSCVSTSQSGSRSHSGPGSISASNSGSGTNTSSNSGSNFWSSSGVESGFMGLMRARLRDDSSVTSLSNVGSDFSNGKRRMPLRQPTAVRIGSEDEDAMDVDRPARSVSVPLREVRSSAVVASSQSNASPIVNSNLRTHYTIGSSPVVSFSTPALPTTTGAARVAFLDPASCASSNPSSDDLSPPGDPESGGSADAEGASGKSSQVSPDDSEDNGASSEKVKSWPEVTETTPATVQEKKSKSSSTAKPIESTESTKAKSTSAEGGAGTVPSSLQPVPEIVQHKIPEADLMLSELDQRAAGHAVIDYKLPRQLHQDLSPAPLMSHTNPIWTVVQDMREQRMSLCQSLRQYVFVHAAVIEGALLMVDEEREMWGEFSGSDESPEPLGDGGRRSDDSDIRQTPLMNMGSMEISRTGRNRSTRDRTRSFPPIGGRSSVSSSCGSQIPRTTTSSVVSSSPSKWKRGPSPTELLREDKSGAVSTAKRPTFHHRTLSKEQALIASDLTAGAPQTLSSGVGRRTSNLASGDPPGTYATRTG